MLTQVENVIMEVREVKTKTQTAIVKEFCYYAKKILLTASKDLILADGTDLAIITAQRQVFDIGQEQFVDDTTDNADIILDVGGQIITLNDLVNGQSGIEFTSFEPGEHLIKSVNELVENTEMVVIAQ